MVPVHSRMYHTGTRMAKTEYVLTIDVGTGSGRAVLFDRAGREVSIGQREWLLESVREYPGAFNFNIKEAWRLLIECIKEALCKAGVEPGQIAGVTATSMREGMVLYDSQKKEIWACPNADARARSEVEEMVEKGLGEIIYKTGGDWLNIISPARFWWIKRQLPDLYKKITFMNRLSDWVLYKLSGQIVTDVTCGSSSGIFDLQRRTWSEELVQAADLPKNIYPPVYEPATVVGRVSKEAARETMLSEGIPVITAGADTQMALLGTGAVKTGMFTVVGGTFWQTAVVADWALIDPGFRLRTLCHAVPGQWMVEGIGFLIGFTMRWFRDEFCLQEVKEAREQHIDPYFLMEKLAEKMPPGSNGVQALFSDAMNARKWKHGTPAFIGFDILQPGATGKAACVRAIEEQAAYTSRAHFEILKEISRYDPVEITFCGGSSKGFLWPRIMADVLGLRLRIPLIKEATSLGSFFCAAVALGWFENIQKAAEKVVQWEQEYIPLEENKNAYNDCYLLWHKVYPYALSIADEGLLPSMWRAPGT
jgi:autoinducer 2 (AI-2) kinase